MPAKSLDMTNKLFSEKSDLIEKSYIERNYAQAIRDIIQLADLANQYIDENKPWVLAKDPKQVNKVVEISTIALNLFRILIIYLKPVIPGIAERCELFLNEKNMNWSDKDKILAGSKINTYKNIIERIDKDQTDKLIEESKL